MDTGENMTSLAEVNISLCWSSFDNCFFLTVTDLAMTHTTNHLSIFINTHMVVITNLKPDARWPRVDPAVNTTLCLSVAMFSYRRG